MRLDLAHRQTAGVKADNPIVKPVKPGLPFGHDPRLKAAVAVARHRDRDRAILANHRLTRIAVVAVSAAAARQIAFLVTQRLAQLGAQRAFEKPLLELFEQPLLADQILRRAIALQQLLDELVPD